MFPEISWMKTPSFSWEAWDPVQLAPKESYAQCSQVRVWSVVLRSVTTCYAGLTCPVSLSGPQPSRSPEWPGSLLFQGATRTPSLNKYRSISVDVGVSDLHSARPPPSRPWLGRHQSMQSSERSERMGGSLPYRKIHSCDELVSHTWKSHYYGSGWHGLWGRRASMTRCSTSMLSSRSDIRRFLYMLELQNWPRSWPSTREDGQVPPVLCLFGWCGGHRLHLWSGEPTNMNCCKSNVHKWDKLTESIKMIMHTSLTLHAHK